MQTIWTTRVSSPSEERAAANDLRARAALQRPKKADLMRRTARFLVDLVDTIVAARTSDHGVKLVPPPAV